MLPHQPLDLDHSTRLLDDPTAVGDRIVHASCNRARRGGAVRDRGPEGAAR